LQELLFLIDSFEIQYKRRSIRGQGEGTHKLVVRIAENNQQFYTSKDVSADCHPITAVSVLLGLLLYSQGLQVSKALVVFAVPAPETSALLLPY
jgi:hypothetical protein